MTKFRKAYVITGVLIAGPSLLSLAGAITQPASFSDGIVFSLWTSDVSISRVYLLWYVAAVVAPLALLFAFPGRLLSFSKETRRGMLWGVSLGGLVLAGTCVVNVNTVLGRL